MKINLNFLFGLMGILIIVMIAWNVYLLKITSDLRKEKSKIEEKHQHLEAFIEVLEYDLVIARDSVRILTMDN